jgi:hypothetical protein
VCKQILSDTTTAKSLPAIPNAQTASDWSSAVNYFATGAQDCIDGIASANVTLTQKADTEFQSGNTKLEATVSDIKALTNH